MNESAASLETSELNKQSNSKTVNNGAAGDGKAPNKQEQQEKKPASLAEMFGSKKDESSLEISLDDDDTPDDPNAPIDSIQRLMKRNNLTEEQVYKIKIPMPDGAEALTIGELKDKTRDLVDFETRVLQFDERRIKQEGELLRSQAEIKDLLETLPKDAIKPEVLKKLRERRDVITRREKMLTLEHIPEWRDEKKRTAELEGIVEMFSDYGFDDSFIETLVDHRAMKFVRDTYLMRKRIQSALAAVRDPKGINKKTSGKAARAAIRPNKESSTRRSAVTQTDRIREWFQSKE